MCIRLDANIVTGDELSYCTRNNLPIFFNLLVQLTLSYVEH